MKTNIIGEIFELAHAKLAAMDVIDTILKSGESALSIITMVQGVLNIVTREDVKADEILLEIERLQKSISDNDKAADERLKRRFTKS